MADPGAHKPGFQPADLLLILFVALFLWLAVPQLELAFDVLVGGAILENGNLRAVDLWANGAILLVIFGMLPFLWVLGTRNEAWRGTLLYFRLHHPLRSAVWGVGLGIGLVIALVIVGLIMELVGAAPENPAIEQLSAVMTWPLALFLSFSAAVGEEILFRGVLQRWIGVWGQAAVFAMLHAWQGVYGIAFTLLLALVFGFMVKRGGSLWIAIVAHFTFDIIQMAVLIAYPEGA